MPITQIKIENYKSIKQCKVDLTDVDLLIGENGSGKSNLLEAMNYFYENLTDDKMREDIFDRNNRFSNEVIITVTFDLSQFIKISKSNSRLNESDEYDDNGEAKYNGYYRAILLLASDKKDGQIKVKMSQIKGKKIKWNYSYQERQLIKSLFPVFFIDSRQLDVKEWSYIWDIIGELAKVSNRERKKLETELASLLCNPDNSIERKLNRITAVFEKSGVDVRKATSRTFAQKITETFFSGDEIYQNGRSPSYYSTGTNSVKYLEVLISIIDELSKAKLKEPLILMDEPEISLHHCYIDELTANISRLTGKSRLLISTHSSRLTKNIIVGSDEVNLYKVNLVEKYTKIKKMKSFAQYSPTSKYRVTDEHINSYFSKVVLFVEGETELELFANPYLKILFPVLERTDVFKAVSDKPVLNIMNPRETGTCTPYIILIDMDKALSYKIKENEFTLKPEYIKRKSKECLQYRSKKDSRSYLKHQFERIMAMSKKLKIRYYLPFYSSKDENYIEFLDAIKEYLWAYNVFAFDTTIEGALVNKHTREFTLSFLEQKLTNKAKGKQSNQKNYKDFCAALEKYSWNDQLNMLRYTFKGKSDLLQYDIINQNGFTGKNSVEKIQGSFDKATGWVSDFLDCFFAEKTGMGGDLSIKAFRRYLEKEVNYEKLISEFKYYFPELFSLIKKIHVIIN